MDLIKTNIVAELAAVRTDRNDSLNIEVPRSYFTWDGALTYQCPAIFCIVDSAEFPDERTQANYASALVRVYVTVVHEGTSEENLTIEAERYQAALFKILHQTIVNDPTNNVKIYTRCKRFEFSPLYTKSRANDNMSDFRKEVSIELEVQHWENPTA